MDFRLGYDQNRLSDQKREQNQDSGSGKTEPEKLLIILFLVYKNRIDVLHSGMYQSHNINQMQPEFDKYSQFNIDV